MTREELNNAIERASKRFKDTVRTADEFAHKIHGNSCYPIYYTIKEDPKENIKEKVDEISTMTWKFVFSHTWSILKYKWTKLFKYTRRENYGKYYGFKDLKDMMSKTGGLPYDTLLSNKGINPNVLNYIIQEKYTSEKDQCGFPIKEYVIEDKTEEIKEWNRRRKEFDKKFFNIEEIFKVNEEQIEKIKHNAGVPI